MGTPAQPRAGTLKFHRQHVIGAYILDFYCAQHHLVVELDGGIHRIQVEYNAGRTSYLLARGYQVPERAKRGGGD